MKLRTLTVTISRFRVNKLFDCKYDLQYAPCSIIEMVDPSGNSHSQLRVFDKEERSPDLEVPEDSYLMEMKNLNKGVELFDTGKPGRKGPKMLFCITMYQETWSQILQSIAGWVRSIYELDGRYNEVDDDETPQEEEESDDETEEDDKGMEYAAK